MQIVIPEHALQSNMTHQHVILWSYIYGFGKDGAEISLQQIADALGISKSKVGNTIQTLRQIDRLKTEYDTATKSYKLWAL